VLDKVSRAQATIGKAAAVPIVLGPVSFVCLAKVMDGSSLAQSVSKLLPSYCVLLKELKAMGVSDHPKYGPYGGPSVAVRDVLLPRQSTFWW